MIRPVRTLLFPILCFLVPMTGLAHGGSRIPWEISAPEVENMMERDQAVLVHVLSKTEYDMQHIPGSINIPITDLGTTNALPRDKNTPLIFYSMGKRCPYASRAATIAAGRGYTNIRVFAGGIPEWRQFNYPLVINPVWQKIKVRKIPPTDVAERLKNQDFYILDVRHLDPGTGTGYLRGSVACPLVYLSERYQEIPRERTIFITDRAMKQSPVAAKFLISKGYRVSGVLKGGLERWMSEKLPLEAEKPVKSLAPLSSRKQDSTR